MSKRQIELARRLLESKGYEISRVREASEYDGDYEEEDDDSKWDPYNGKKYSVYGGYGSGSVLTDDPKEAIEAWFKLGQDSPTDTAIMAKKKVDAVELNKVATEEYLTSLYSKYKCPYKLEYLIKDAAKKVADGQLGFYEGSYGYGDTVHPFGVG